VKGKKNIMRRIRIFVAYDGTNYCGWQIQPNGITIEEKLNKALNRLTGEDIRVIGASRTDSGVHALGNVAVFDTESPIPPERFSYAFQSLFRRGLGKSFCHPPTNAEKP
jgi:tRNA pseudouridine38-40 synthase